MARKEQVGELRPSQLLHTYGVGAIVDLPNISAMVMGLEDWSFDASQTIVEDRLLAAVRHQLGDQVQRLVSAPIPPQEAGFARRLDGPSVGVPVTAFPRWMRCPSCSKLGPRLPGIFDLKPDFFRPDKTRYVHSNCPRAMPGRAGPPVLPARFVVACERGHLDDFPWSSFVHRSQQTTCHGELSLFEIGVSGEAAEVIVKCLACEKSRSMADAFGEEGLLGYRCRGRRAHLRDFETKPCEERPRTILLGASNGWFPVQLSALYVPPRAGSKLAELVEAHWLELAKVDEFGVLKYLHKEGKLLAFRDYPLAEVWAAIEQRQARPEQPAEEEPDLKQPEWEVFSNPSSAPSQPDFRLVEVAPPATYRSVLSSVLLAERLREVSALTGFTRIASPLDFDDTQDPSSEHRVPLARKKLTQVPASEVRGEGIFLRFDEHQVADWCRGRGGTQETLERDALFNEAHRRWRRARNLSPEGAGYPGLRYVLLHSFSHALMRQLSLECGYSAASIRERIYAREPDEGAPMAGILLYTAAPDSEGTLGGLVSLGRPEHLGRHIEQALEQMHLCASDPLCSEHLPVQEIRSSHVSLHGAACHACLLAPETSCERGNKYLDRTLLAETLTGAGLSFFRGRS